MNNNKKMISEDFAKTLTMNSIQFILQQINSSPEMHALLSDYENGYTKAMIKAIVDWTFDVMEED